MKIRGHLIVERDKEVIRVRADTVSGFMKLAKIWDAIIIEDEDKNFILTPLDDKRWLLVYSKKQKDNA